MKELLEKETFKPLQPGKIVKGKVLAKGKRELLVDISPWGTGKVYGGEFLKAKEKLKSIKEGDEIWAKIVDVDNEDNFVELSLSEVMEELKLNELREKKEKGEKIVVQIFGANKGGLLTQIEGFPAFLPISQMEEKIVQELQDEEKSNVLKKLRQFVGKRIEVKILTILNPQRQIILTQKEKEPQTKIGSEVEGTISAITEFGIFVDCNDFEAILSADKIGKINPKIGEKIKAKVEKIENGKIYLTIDENEGTN